MDDFIRQAKAIADPTRMRILKLLQMGELCVCDIMDVMRLAQSTASKHLGILKTAGLVESRKSGTWTYYKQAEKARGDNKQFLEFVTSRMNNDPQVKRDKRLLAKRNPAICER